MGIRIGGGKKRNFDFFVNFIEKISCTRDLSEYIYSISNGTFHLTKLDDGVESEGGAYYYLNHCASCGKSIGDISLYDIPGQGFCFRTHAKMQSSVVLHPPPLGDSPTIHIMAYFQCRVPDSECAKLYTENLCILPPVNKDKDESKHINMDLYVNKNPHNVSNLEKTIRYLEEGAGKLSDEQKAEISVALKAAAPRIGGDIDNGTECKAQPPCSALV